MGRNNMRQGLGDPTMACRQDPNIVQILCLVVPLDRHSNRTAARAGNVMRIWMGVFLMSEQDLE